MGLKRVFCFQEWGLSPPQLGEEWSEVCLESRVSSSGTLPPSQSGKPTLEGDSSCLLCVHGLRPVCRSGRWAGGPGTTWPPQTQSRAPVTLPGFTVAAQSRA